MTRAPRLHPYGPLAPHLEGDQARHTRARLGISGATLDRWRAEGLTDTEADRAATRLGLNPRALWPRWEDAGADVVPVWLWDAVHPTAVAVWAVLARLARLDGAHGRTVTVSVRAIADEAALSDRWVQRCVRQLEHAGAVTVEHQALGPAAYTLHPNLHPNPVNDQTPREVSTAPGTVAS